MQQSDVFRPHRATHEDVDLEIDLARFRVRRRGCDVDVTPTELGLLSTLARRPGVVVSPTRLNGTSSGAFRPMTAASLYTMICSLRQKLHAAGLPYAIRTVRSRGYALADDLVVHFRH